MGSYEHIHLPWQDWKITCCLGSGTYGRVYEIERNIAGIQERAALKIISRPKDSSEIEACYDNGYDRASIIESYEKEIQSYVQEYNIMKELQGQSNIVSCDDFAVVPHEDGIGGDIFLRMELLTSLPQILRQQMLSEQEIIKLGKDISRALMLCESKNIIHRDIKPVNIMVSKFGDYKLGDFGVSKIMDHATYATAMGTPEYQAPEVVHMEKYGKTADIYSLGITLYWLLNNRKMPFIGAEQRLTPVIKNEATDRRYRGEQLPPPRDGSAELKQIVLKACAYSPQERYLSAEEMNQALECIGNCQTTIRSEQQLCDETVGPDRFWEKEFSQQTAWGGEDYGGNQTAGNSWGASNGTIGKSGKNAQKKRAEDISEEAYTATVGVKQACQKHQKKSSGIKPESEKIAQSFSAEKGLSKDITPSKWKSSLGKIVICLIVIWIILDTVKGRMGNTSLEDNASLKNELSYTDLITIYDNIPLDGFEEACQWLENNKYSFEGSDGQGTINDSILLSFGSLSYKGKAAQDMEEAHECYVELSQKCQEQWDIVLEADQKNQCASEDDKVEVCVFGGVDNRIYILRRDETEISLESYSHFKDYRVEDPLIIDVNDLSIPWNIIADINLSGVEQLHMWADANEFGFFDDSAEDGSLIDGLVYQPKDITVTKDDRGVYTFGPGLDICWDYGYMERKDGTKSLAMWMYDENYSGANVADIIKQIVALLEKNSTDGVKANDKTYIGEVVCEYQDKEVYLVVRENGCDLKITESNE